MRHRTCPWGEFKIHLPELADTAEHLSPSISGNTGTMSLYDWNRGKQALYCGEIYQMSDARNKENIEDLPPTLQILAATTIQPKRAVRAVFSIPSACDVNKCIGEDDYCLSQAFLKNPNGGAVAFVGSTGKGIINPNDYPSPSYTDYFCANLFSNLCNKATANTSTCIGSVFNKALSKVVSRISNPYYIYTACAVNLMADPTMNVYTESPQSFNYNYSRVDNSRKFTFNELPPKTSVCITTVDGMTIKSLEAISNKTYVCETSEPINIVIYSPNYFPEIITPNKYKTLHINNCIIDRSLTYEAEDIILGENVVIKSGAKLQLHYSGKLTIKNAVKCEKGSELIIQSIN